MRDCVVLVAAKASNDSLQIRCVHNGNGRVCNEDVRYRGAQNMLDVMSLPLRHEAPCAHRRCCEFEAVLRSSRRRLRWRYAGIDGCEVATCVAACLNHRPLTCQWSSLGTSTSASEWCKHDCKLSYRRSHSWHKRMGCRRDLRREVLNTSSPTALNWLLQLRLIQFFMLSQQESHSVIFRFSRMTIS